VRRQSRPRRWPWQPKTIRDLVNDRSADLLELAAERSAELADLLAERRDDMAAALRRQAQPRRWPWQPKTARDRVDRRVSELTERAAERSAELAALAATRRDNVIHALERQSRPRRWPWQPKTARDYVDARVAVVADQASAQRDLLAMQAARRRDALVAEFEHQSRPRRWPWQGKTVRDRAEERIAALVDQAATRRDDLRSQADEVLAQADERRRQLQAELEHQARPRRWPWQSKTARDRAEERLSELGSRAASTRDELSRLAVDQRDQLGEYVRSARSEGADATGRLQEALKAAPAVLGAAATGAVESVRTTADSTAAAVRGSASDIGKRIGETTESASQSVKAVAHAPVDVLNRKVESGRRTVRWTVRLAKFSFWALLAGAAVGVLYSPRSGREVRQEIRFNINRILDMILPVD
jgi:gas vesicle protein